MAEETKTYVFQPDGNSNGWMAAMNNGGGLLGNGFIGSLFGGFLGSMFPNLFGGYGMGGVGGGAGYSQQQHRPYCPGCYRSGPSRRLRVQQVLC